MDYFVIENGLLVKKLFVGPIYQPVKEKIRISDRDDRLENVNEVERQAKHLADQQLLASKAIGKTEETSASSTDVTRKYGRKKNRVFHYSNVAEVLAKGYWNTERRSLTKYHSNSLMTEYSSAQSFSGSKKDMVPGPIPTRTALKVIRRRKSS